VSGPCARLSWPSRQLLSARKSTVSYRIVSYHVGSQAAAACVVFTVSDIERCRKCGKCVPCTRRTAQGKDCELIITVKMETRHPVEGLFGSEFRAICNHCVVMAA